MTRRTLLATLPALSLYSAPAPARASRMQSLDSITERYSEIWRIPGRFTKNPDIIELPSGKMMLTFADADRHWAEEVTRVTTLESTDRGKTWGNAKVIAEADRRKGEERWITPRISLLRDGRIVIICDHDDYAHVHQDQSSGIWSWESRDEGRTWSKAKLTGVPGIEPDRIVELANGHLLIAAHMTYRDTRKLGMFVMRSTDGGATWKDLTTIAADKIHHHCEGAIVLLKGGELACVMRENNHAGYPSYLSFSSDQGKTWSKVQPLPFAGDRPFAQQLKDGRVLVTYRNQSGNRGTHAWIGDLKNNPGYQVGGTHYNDEVSFEGKDLRMHALKGATTRYTLMPPESFWSDVLFEATLRVAGPAEQGVGVIELGRLGVRLEYCADGLWLHRGTSLTGKPTSFPTGVPSTDRIFKVDLTKPRTVRLETIAGRLQLSIDGKPALHWVIMTEFPLRETYFGRIPESSGDVWWTHVIYRTKNQSEPNFEWTWSASRGEFPDQYQIDNMLELRANPPINPEYPPDNGYSSWLERSDGSIYFVDYTNRGNTKPQGHLYSMRFNPADFIKR